MQGTTLNEYQAQAMTTCKPTSHNYVYMAEGMVGEMGEFTSKVAKAIRKGEVAINDNQLMAVNSDMDMTELMNGLKGELGDILWFVAGLASVFGWNLEDVGYENLLKLQSRKARGKIEGNGDNR